MATHTALPLPAAAPLLPKLSTRELLPWLLFGGLLMLVLLYLVGAEGGAASLVGGTWVHEFAHDGRHLLAFPCH